MIDDETLMAYADGELGPAEMKAVEEAAHRDAATANRLAAHAALRAKMAEAFADVLHDPVPARLSALASEGGNDGSVIDLAAACALRRPEAKPKSAWPVGGAMAACLTAGLLIGAGLEALRPAPLLSGRDGSLQAQGSLEAALNTQLAANPSGARSIRIGVSFRDTRGDYCRTFRIDRETALAGIACRDPAAWLVKMAVATPSSGASTDYRTASSDIPPSVMQAVENLSAGDPLDAKGEAQAKARRWLK